MSTRLQGIGAALLVALGAVGLAVSATAAGENGGDTTNAPVVGDWLEPDPAGLLSSSASAMSEVSSVRFDLRRTGAPVFLDPAESLALDRATGRVVVPNAADALLSVVVNGDLKTELGAVAVEGDVWLSNPVTGVLEPLPPGMDLDPRSFFDPAGAWAPMLRSLADAELVAQSDDRYHLRATAPGGSLAEVTAGLIDDLDTTIDLWLHPVTAHVTRLEFETSGSGGTTRWIVELGDFDADFVIEAPQGDGG